MSKRTRSRTLPSPPSDAALTARFQRLVRLRVSLEQLADNGETVGRLARRIVREVDRILRLDRTALEMTDELTRDDGKRSK